MIKAKPLPFAKDALVPNISERTMEFHYEKHYKGYVDNTNKLLKGSTWENEDLEYIIRHIRNTSVANNAQQVWNHEFYWKCIAPGSPPLNPKSNLYEAMEQQFGEFDDFKNTFIQKHATQLFGSGWVWLVREKSTLRIVNGRNADIMLPDEHTQPILVCDVWEHAYYLDFQNDRKKYVEKGFFPLINWEFAEKQFDG